MSGFSQLNPVPIVQGGTGASTQTGAIAALKEGMLYTTLVGADFNSTADQAIPITLPTGMTKYRLQVVMISNPNPSSAIATATGGIYTAASKGGIAIVPASQVYSGLTTSTVGTTGSLLLTAVTNQNTSTYNSTPLYLSLTSAELSAKTADVTIIYMPIP